MGEVAYDSPSEMPEIPRELTMLKGALSALDTKLSNLLPRLESVIRQQPEAIAGADVEIPTGSKRQLAPFTPLGQELRALTEEVGRMEDAIERRLMRLAL